MLLLTSSWTDYKNVDITAYGDWCRPNRNNKGINFKLVHITKVNIKGEKTEEGVAMNATHLKEKKEGLQIPGGKYVEYT